MCIIRNSELMRSNLSFCFFRRYHSSCVRGGHRRTTSSPPRGLISCKEYDVYILQRLSNSLRQQLCRSNILKQICCTTCCRLEVTCDWPTNLETCQTDRIQGSSTSPEGREHASRHHTHYKHPKKRRLHACRLPVAPPPALPLVLVDLQNELRQ